MYDVYMQTTEELIKLRQAHTVLISMIQSGNVNIKQHAQNLNDQSIDFKHFDSSQQFSSRSHLHKIMEDGTQKPSLHAPWMKTRMGPFVGGGPWASIFQSVVFSPGS